MSESTEQVTPIDGDPKLGAADPDDDLIAATATTTADGKKMVSVPLDTIIGLRRGQRELSAKVKEFEGKDANYKALEHRLEEAAPIITAVASNPQLRAAALKHAGATRPSAEHTEQPQDDAEATAAAEEFGFYLADGVTPDAARGARVLARLGRMSKAHAEEMVRPIASLTLGQRAEANISRAVAETDANGVPLATPESIKEAVAMLGSSPELLANPAVSQMILSYAIGQDRIKGRTPQAREEPVWLATAGGRGSREPVISADEKRRLERLGLSEKDYQAAGTRLDSAMSRRGGIVLE